MVNQRKCCTCKEYKIIDVFSYCIKNGKRKFNARCKECQIKYSRLHYKNNKDKYLKRNRKRKLVIRQKIFDYLKEHPCIKCGESRIACLDFHHRDPCKKSEHLGRLRSCTQDWNVIKEEIDKCDVLCSNCHRIVTAKEKNWYGGIV